MAIESACQQHISVSFPSGHMAVISFIGKLSLNSHIQLKDVLCVPSSKLIFYV